MTCNLTNAVPIESSLSKASKRYSVTWFLFNYSHTSFNYDDDDEEEDEDEDEDDKDGHDDDDDDDSDVVHIRIFLSNLILTCEEL